MNKNYAMIDGKEIVLDEAMAKHIVHNADIWRRALIDDEVYYYISFDGSVEFQLDYGEEDDKGAYDVANYCLLEEPLKQRALHETLSRLLWRYALQHGGIAGCDQDGYLVCKWSNSEPFVVNLGYRSSSDVRFASEADATAALRDIVKPFLVAYPEFKW